MTYFIRLADSDFAGLTLLKDRCVRLREACQHVGDHGRALGENRRLVLA